MADMAKILYKWEAWNGQYKPVAQASFICKCEHI